MKLTLIAAMDESRLIGTGEGGLPWEGLERDKAHFRDYVAGKALLLGRRTFEEMSGWFDAGHRPLVVTRDGGYAAEGGHPAVASVEAGIALARERGEQELVVIGGATIYGLAIARADQLVLTIVHSKFDAPAGGAYFPEWEGLGFEELRREWFGAGGGCAFGLTFLWLEKPLQLPE